MKLGVQFRTQGTVHYGKPLDFKASSPDVIRRPPRAPRAPRGRRVRTTRTSHGPPGRRTDADDGDPDLAAELEALVAELGPLPACELALLARRRKATVLEVLHSDRRFVRTGSRRASRWHLAQARSFDAVEAASRWDVSVELAEEFLTGPDGFLARGFVTNGGARYVVTGAGREIAWVVESTRPSESPRLPALSPTPMRGGASAGEESS